MGVADIAQQLAGALDRAVKGDQTLYAIAKAAGLKPELLYRFVRGGDLRLKSAAKLAAVLGLELVPRDATTGARVEAEDGLK